MTIGRIPSVEGGIQPTIVDAKGDLIAGVAADSINRLAVGSNDQVLVADSSTSTGLAWKSVATPFAAGKNKIINGDFNIWQRGTSFSNPAHLSLTADRWSVFHDGSGATRTVSQQTFTPGAAPVSGYEGSTFFRYAVTAAGTSNTYQSFGQKIEDVRTFANQTVTVSFWAKVASGTPTVKVMNEQAFGSGGSSAVYTQIGSNLTMSTSWQRYSVTGVIPSVSGKTIGTSSYSNIYFELPNATTITIDIWGVQLEAGNTATAFQTATGTLQGELAACQRYYVRKTADSSALYATFGTSIATSTTGHWWQVPLPVQMRVTPTSMDYSAIRIQNINNGYPETGGLTLSASNSHSLIATGSGSVASGLTSGNFYWLGANNSSTAYIGFSAEL